MPKSFYIKEHKLTLMDRLKIPFCKKLITKQDRQDVANVSLEMEFSKEVLKCGKLLRTYGIISLVTIFSLIFFKLYL